MKQSQKNDLVFIGVMGFFLVSCSLIAVTPIIGGILFIVGVPTSLILAINYEKPNSREVKE